MSDQQASSPALVQLHQRVLQHLRTDDYRRALPPLARLVLATGPHHPAAPDLARTLAFVYRKLGRIACARRWNARAVKVV